MAKDKNARQGNNLNDPDQRPTDIAEHEDRTEETRNEEADTGDRQDIQGHTPKVPSN